MEEEKKDYLYWRRALHAIKEDDNLKISVLKKMAETAKTFSDWEHIRENTFGILIKNTKVAEVDALRTIALKKMEELAKTFDEYKKVNDITSGGFIFEMTELAKTYDDWDEIKTKSPKGSKIETAALEKMVELAEKFYQWEDIWKTIYYEFDFVSSNTSHHTILNPEEKRKSQTIAIEKMVELAKDFSEWLKIYDEIYDEIPEGKKLKISILSEMAKIAEDPNDWLLIHERAPRGSEIENIARQKAKNHTVDGYPQL